MAFKHDYWPQKCAWMRWKDLGWKRKCVGGEWAQGAGLQESSCGGTHTVSVPPMRRCPSPYFPSYSHSRPGEERPAEEAINSTKLRFGQLTRTYASSSGEGGSGFPLTQPVKDGVMLSRLLGNQQKVFQSPLCPHSEYQSHDSLTIWASGAQRRRESALWVNYK